MNDVIPVDIPCANCGYNLRGLRVAGACPECGTVVAASVLTVGAALVSRGWFLNVRRGAQRVLRGIAALVGAGATLGLALTILPAFPAAMILALYLSLGAAIVGIKFSDAGAARILSAGGPWLYESADEALRRRARRAARWLQFLPPACCVACALLFGVLSAGEILYLPLVIWLGTWGCACGAYYRYVERLARFLSTPALAVDAAGAARFSERFAAAVIPLTLLAGMVEWVIRLSAAWGGPAPFVPLSVGIGALLAVGGGLYGLGVSSEVHRGLRTTLDEALNIREPGARESVGATDPSDAGERAQ